MIFQDRAAAGRTLADRLAALPDIGAGGRPLVLALPRGGVPVAAPVAGRLGAELDVVVVRKIGAPGRPEYGIGAIAEDGPPYFDHPALAALGLTERDLARTVERERAELDRRIRRYRGERPAPRAAGRTVIVVDDGLATGVTARAAVRWLRDQGPEQLILAVPVCAREARDALARSADLVVCVHAPGRFRAVGEWYLDFAQTSDAEVDQLLAH